MPQEERLGVSGFGVAHVCVPRATSIEVVLPAHWMVSAVGPALVALLVDLHESVDRRIDRLEVVELVLAIDGVGQSGSRWMILVDNAEDGFSNVGVVGMPVEPGPGEPAVPRPIVLGVGCGMNTNVSAAG